MDSVPHNCLNKFLISLKFSECTNLSKIASAAPSGASTSSWLFPFFFLLKVLILQTEKWVGFLKGPTFYTTKQDNLPRV